MEKTTVHITGMHCRSCEILIEDEVLKIPGVEKCIVNHTKGTAEIYHNDGLDEQEVSQAISTIGYQVGKEERPWLSKNPADYADLFVAAGILFFIYLVMNNLGLFNLFNFTSNNFTSLPVVLLIGLTAGFSTCMALVGGLVLGSSARFAEKHPTATPLQKFKPHLFFNIGRITSYFFFGGVIGFAGSFFSLSPTLLGFLTIIVGGVMFLLGAQLINISPKLNKVNITLPKFISRALGVKEHNEREYSHKNSMILGVMTFFLPCGFTQAMQLYAISTGDPIKGAITMGAFALGTAPGLLGIGGLTSIVKGAFAKAFFRFAGIIVIILAVFNISNGYNLTGVAFASPFSSNTASTTLSDPNVTLENEIQVVRMTQNASGYSPNTFTIKKDTPVKWIVNSEDVNTCASSIVSSPLNIRASLNLGENIFEFTPTEAGVLKFNCSMGMYRGAFNVVNDDGSSALTQQELQKQVAAPAGGGGSCGSSGGCGCGAGAASAQKKLQATASSSPAPVTQQGNIQIIKTTYTQDNDIQPNRFNVKIGQPVRMEIDVKDNGYGCMGSIMVPGLTQTPQILTKDKPIVFNFTPTKTGEYLITCAMGIPRGVIQVN